MFSCVRIWSHLEKKKKNTINVTSDGNAAPVTGVCSDMTCSGVVCYENPHPGCLLKCSYELAIFISGFVQSIPSFSPGWSHLKRRTMSPDLQGSVCVSLYVCVFIEERRKNRMHANNVQIVPLAMMNEALSSTGWGRRGVSIPNVVQHLECSYQRHEFMNLGRVGQGLAVEKEIYTVQYVGLFVLGPPVPSWWIDDQLHPSHFDSPKKDLRFLSRETSTASSKTGL